jgi:hypothetical protein
LPNLEKLLPTRLLITTSCWKLGVTVLHDVGVDVPLAKYILGVGEHVHNGIHQCPLPVYSNDIRRHSKVAMQLFQGPTIVIFHFTAQEDNGNVEGTVGGREPNNVEHGHAILVGCICTVHHKY